jgi:hypothetical protein
MIGKRSKKSKMSSDIAAIEWDELFAKQRQVVKSLT